MVYYTDGSKKIIYVIWWYKCIVWCIKRFKCL